MSRRVHDDEPDRDCDAAGSAMQSQLDIIPAAFAVLNIPRPEWGPYIRDVLAYHRMAWRHGGKLEKLSCRQAGLVLEALHFGARGAHHGQRK
jgi:hypothetical protein